MRKLVFVLGLALAASAPAAVSESANPQIDFTGHAKLVADVGKERPKRLLSLAEFKAMAAKGVTVLDARSAWAYKAGHIKGAVNLPLTDFTPEDVARVLGDPKKPVLIYCNNNFKNRRPPVMLKSGPAAVNIQTSVALAAYGYTNVWELGEVIDFDDPAVGWVKG
jgi:phage shock protein E